MPFDLDGFTQERLLWEKIFEEKEKITPSGNDGSGLVLILRFLSYMSLNYPSDFDELNSLCEEDHSKKRRRRPLFLSQYHCSDI